MKAAPAFAILSIVAVAMACSDDARTNDARGSGPDTSIAADTIPSAELYKTATDSAILAGARALMLADSNVALVTVDGSGQPRVRTVKAFIDTPAPGIPQKGVTVWIMTRLTTRKVDQIRQHPNVALYFNDDAKVSYASIMGRAVVHTDPENADAKRFYDPGYAEFFWPEFPKGFVMIEVKPRWLEYLGPDIAGNPQTWRPQAVVFPPR